MQCWLQQASRSKSLWHVDIDILKLYVFKMFSRLYNFRILPNKAYTIPKTAIVVQNRADNGSGDFGAQFGFSMIPFKSREEYENNLFFISEVLFIKIYKFKFDISIAFVEFLFLEVSFFF